MNMRRRVVAGLAGILLAGAGAPTAFPQDAPKPAAPAPAEGAKSGKDAKVRRYLELVRFRETMLEQLDAGFEAQAKMGVIPKNFSKKFKEVADFKVFEEIFVEVWGDALDEATLDALNAFLATDAGQKYVKAQMTVTRPMLEKIQPWAMTTAMKTMQALAEEGEGEDEEMEEGEEEGESSVLDSLGRAKRSANETAAIATLRNLASCQAQMQTSGKIDCDQDGIGEYGTLLEMTGTVGVRKGFESLDHEGAWGSSDFSKQGTPVTPPIMSPALAGVDDRGVVVKSGYCFRIFLPDTAEKNAGFVHEKGPKEKVGLAGGTGKVCVDLAETTWCAYAWPEKRGESGARVFFVNQAGDVLQSANEKHKWEGERAPTPDAAFRHAGITSQVAVGTAGRDGEVWKVTN